MNFSSTLKKIESSKEFKQFKKQHPDAYLCVGFFVLDYEQGNNQQQLDYSLKNGKIFTFALNENQEITFKEAERISGKQEILPEISKKIKVDIPELRKTLEKRMEKEEIQNRIIKIIAILQKHEDNQIWNLNCILEGMGILQAHIGCMNKKILKFEKKNLFDFVKKVK